MRFLDTTIMQEKMNYKIQFETDIPNEILQAFTREAELRQNETIKELEDFVTETSNINLPHANNPVK